MYYFLRILQMDEQKLLDELKQLPDFSCYVLPATWYKKFGLTPPGPVAPREFMESNYTMKCAIAPKDLPTLIISKPQQDGKLYDMFPEEKVDVEVRNRPYTLTETPNILPSLTDETIGN
jgi:hypothetical protein